MTMFSILGLVYFVLITAGSTPNVLAQDVAFNGVDDTSYVDWLETVNYVRSVFLPGPNPSDGAAIHWSIIADQIQLAVAVRATGWAAFGISENGGMRGADMVIFEADGENLIDAHVLQDLFPISDSCQSWTLRNSVSEGGFLIFEASRFLDTKDTQDHAIFDDRSTVARRIVAAWGDTSSYSYHGLNRSRGSVRFFSNDKSDEWAAFADQMDTESEGSLDLLAKDYAIPRRETIYEDFCFLESDLLAMGMPANTALHTIGLQPIVDERTTPYVHHFIVYGSSDPTRCGGQEVAYGWAPGDLPMAFPLNVGGPLGADGFRAFRVAIHYNNPSRLSGLLDSSGVRIFWTSKKREHDMGVFEAGDPIISLMGQPVGNGFTSHDFLCSSACSAVSLSQPITVVSETLHMHISGRRMFNQQIRGGEVIRTGTADYFDYEQQGTQSVVQDQFVIEPGDSFRTRCYYDSQDESFGLASQDEMCIAFLFYYPRQLVAGRLPFKCGRRYGASGFDQCNAEWTQQDLSGVEDLERTFGGSPFMCSAVPAAIQNFGCFSGSSIVHVQGQGATRMHNLQLGDKVLVGSNKYETVYSFGHFAPEAVASFVEIVTEASSVLQISSQHMLFLEGSKTILASQVAINDRLIDASGSPVRVVSIKNMVKSVGIYAPFTESGTLIVDGVLVSSYISLETNATTLTAALGMIEIDAHWLAHASQFPHRVACLAITGTFCDTETYTADGVSTWVALPLQWSNWVLNQPSPVVRLFLLTICMLIVSLLAVAEVCFLNPITFLTFLYLVFQVVKSQRRSMSK